MKRNTNVSRVSDREILIEICLLSYCLISRDESVVAQCLCSWPSYQEVVGSTPATYSCVSSFLFRQRFERRHFCVDFGFYAVG